MTKPDDIYDDWRDARDPDVRKGSVIGERSKIHHFVTVGADPFAYDKGVRPMTPKESAFKAVIGDDVEIMPFANIDRGTVRDTVVGDGTKIDRFVHVAHDAIVGKHCILVAGAIIGGFVELGDEVYVGMNVSIKPRVRIGTGAFIGAGAVVLNDVPEGECWVGNPARFLRKTNEESSS